jgi:prolyl 4-hydroxylase
MKLSLLISILIPSASAKKQVLNAFGEPSYGVDVSFPVHHRTFSLEQPLGDRQKLYDDFMAGCRLHYSDNGQACDVTEEDRVEMSLRQPASMQVRTSNHCTFDGVNLP